MYLKKNTLLLYIEILLLEYYVIILSCLYLKKNNDRVFLHELTSRKKYMFYVIHLGLSLQFVRW